MHRFRVLLDHLRSAKGAAVILAVVAGLVGLVVGGTLGRVLAGIVLALIGGVVLALSALASSQRSDLRQLARDVGAPLRTGSRGQRGAPGQRVASGVDPPPDEAYLEALVRLRAALRRLGPPVSPDGGDQRVATAPTGCSAAGPTVTVVIPCFNEERFIEDAIRSVVAQSYEDWECIVVDDASTDASPRLAQALAASDERITVVRHRANAGLPAARNTGLRLARGAYVTFLDGDDLLTGESLADRVAPLARARHLEVAGCHGGIRPAPESIRLGEIEPSYAWNNGVWVDFVSAAGECPFNAHAPLCRTDLVRAVTGFDESMRDGAEDWDLWARMLRAGFAFVPARARTGIYRQKVGSMVRANLTRHVEISGRLLDAAHQPWDPDESPVLGPRPFPRPLAEYERDTKRAKRVLRSAAMAFVAGQTDVARRLLDELQGISPAIIRHHATTTEAVKAAVLRLSGLDWSTASALKGDIARAVELFDALVAPVLAEEASDVVIRPGPSWDVVAVPTTAVQAQQMLRVREKVGDRRSWVFIDLSRTTGDQGATAVLTAADVEVRSLNEWVLQRHTAATAVVGAPRVAAVDEFLREAGDAVEVMDIDVDGREIMAIDEGPERLVVPGYTVFEAVERLRASRPGSVALRPWTGCWRDVEAAWALEEYPRTWADPERLMQFKDAHRGERCVIIGNGPSLNELDLAPLAEEPTFGVNGIFYKTDEVGIDLLYYVVEDTAVMVDNLERIRSYHPRGHRFFPSIYREDVGEADDTSFFMMNRGFYAPESPDFCVPRFSTDVTQRVYAGQSVTIINLQLAYWMGFSEVVLIGMDFSYTIPDDAEVHGDLITSASDDPNHFHPDYFGKGKVWKDPKLDRVLANYQLAKLMFEADGRRIVNATAGGQLELFDRISYGALYG